MTGFDIKEISRAIDEILEQIVKIRDIDERCYLLVERHALLDAAVKFWKEVEKLKVVKNENVK